MAYTSKPNSGKMWPYDYKKADHHPDIKGDLMIEKSLLQALISKSEDPVKVSIAGWKHKINGKDCVYVQVSEPYVKPKEPEVPDEDVPF